MPKYQWATQYVAPGQITDYKPGYYGRNEQLSQAHNAFPEEFALHTDTTPFHQQPTAPFGTPGPATDPLTGDS